MLIVSAPGRLVRDPVTRRVVDDTAIEVDETDPYWARLLADHDVLAAPEEAPALPVEPVPVIEPAPVADEPVEPEPAPEPESAPVPEITGNQPQAPVVASKDS